MQQARAAHATSEERPQMTSPWTSGLSCQRPRGIVAPREPAACSGKLLDRNGQRAGDAARGAPDPASWWQLTGELRGGGKANLGNLKTLLMPMTSVGARSDVRKFAEATLLGTWPKWADSPETTPYATKMDESCSKPSGPCTHDEPLAQAGRGRVRWVFLRTSPLLSVRLPRHQRR